MKNKPFALIAACFTLAALFFFGHEIRGIFLAATEKPFLAMTKSFLEFKSWIRAVPRISSIIRENEEHQNIIRQLSVDSVELASLKAENDQLKRQLNISKNKPRKLEEVSIFLFSGDIGHLSFYINKGSAEGISVGQPVIYAGNVFVGIVSEIFETRARVSVISNPRTMINVRTEQGETALARGAGTGGLELDFISADDNVREGELLVTSGLDGLAANLIVGTIRRIDENSGELFKKVSIIPAFMESTTNKAFVIIQ